MAAARHTSPNTPDQIAKQPRTPGMDVLTRVEAAFEGHKNNFSHAVRTVVFHCVGYLKKHPAYDGVLGAMPLDAWERCTAKGEGQGKAKRRRIDALRDKGFVLFVYKAHESYVVLPHYADAIAAEAWEKKKEATARRQRAFYARQKELARPSWTPTPHTMPLTADCGHPVDPNAHNTLPHGQIQKKKHMPEPELAAKSEAEAPDVSDFAFDPRLGPEGRAAVLAVLGKKPELPKHPPLPASVTPEESERSAKQARAAHEVAPGVAPAPRGPSQANLRAPHIRPARAELGAALIIPDWTGKTVTAECIAEFNRMYEIDLQAERFIAEGIGWNAVLGALEGMAEKRAQGVFKNPAAACLNAARLRQKGDWGWVKNLSKKSWGPYTGPGRQ